MPTLLRAAIYARFSSDKQRDASIDDQVKACNEYAQRRGYEIVAVYADYAISGRSDDRPQFLQMIEDAKKSKFDIVLVWKIDRFARNMMDQFHYEREMKLHNVTLESCKENISGGTIEADMNKGMLAIFAQIRSQQSAVDTMRGLLGKAEQCQYLGIWRLGYSHEGDTITIDPLTAPIVKRMHDDYLAGMPVNEIIAYLKELGIKTYAGNDPGYQFVTGILKNMAYAGVYMWGQKKDDRGNVIKDAQGKPVPLVYVEGGMPAIVSMETKLACIERLKYRKHSKTKANYMLSGKLFCKAADKQMHGESGKSRLGVEYFYYVAKAANGKRHSIAKDTIEDTVANGIRSMLEDKELCAKLAARHVEYLAEVEDNAPAIEAAENEVKALEKQRENIINAIAQGAPYEAFDGKLNEISEGIIAAKRRVERLTDTPTSATAEEIEAFFADISAGAMSDEQIISAFVGQVVLDGTQAVAVMNFDDKPCERYEINWLLDTKKEARTRRSNPGFVHCLSGSPGRIRTYNPPVNSRMLCR